MSAKTKAIPKLNRSVGKLLEFYIDSQSKRNFLSYDFSGASTSEICRQCGFVFPRYYDAIPYMVGMCEKGLALDLLGIGGGRVRSRTNTIPLVWWDLFKKLNGSDTFMVIPVYDVPEKLGGVILLRLNKNKEIDYYNHTYTHMLDSRGHTNGGLILPPHFSQNKRNEVVMLNDPIATTKLNLETWGKVGNYFDMLPFVGYFDSGITAVNKTTNWDAVEDRKKIFWNYDVKNTGLKHAIEQDSYVYEHEDGILIDQIHTDIKSDFKGGWGDEDFINYLNKLDGEELYIDAIHYCKPWAEVVYKKLHSVPYNKWLGELTLFGIGRDSKAYDVMWDLYPEKMNLAEKSTSYDDIINPNYIETEAGIYRIDEETGERFKISPFKFKLSHIFSFGKYLPVGERLRSLWCIADMSWRHKEAHRVICCQNDRTIRAGLINMFKHIGGRAYVDTVGDGLDLLDAQSCLYGWDVADCEEVIGYNPNNNSYLFKDFKIDKGRISPSFVLPLPNSIGLKVFSEEKASKFDINKIKRFFQDASLNDFLSYIATLAAFTQYKNFNVGIRSGKNNAIFNIVAKGAVRKLVSKLSEFLGCGNRKYLKNIYNKDGYGRIRGYINWPTHISPKKSFLFRLGGLWKSLSSIMYSKDDGIITQNVAHNVAYLTMQEDMIKRDEINEFKDIMFMLFMDSIRFLTTQDVKGKTWEQLTRSTFYYLVYSLELDVNKYRLLTKFVSCSEAALGYMKSLQESCSFMTELETGVRTVSVAKLKERINKEDINTSSKKILLNQIMKSKLIKKINGDNDSAILFIKNVNWSSCPCVSLSPLKR